MGDVSCAPLLPVNLVLSRG
jgi:hypothetical protein